jgi:hypothetical protein
MLNRHPAIGLSDETFFFYYVHHRQRAFGDLASEVNRARVVDRLLETDRIRRLGLDEQALRAALLEHGTDYDRLFLALLEFQAQVLGKKICGEKTPQHAFEVEALGRMFPRGRVIHLVRDPRDVVASLQRMPWGAASSAANARTWSRCVRAAERIQGRPNFLRVHYERLVDQPERELRRICEFVNEPYSKSMLEVDPDAKADRWWFERAQGPLARDRREQWRQELSAAEVAIVEWVAHDGMTLLGYTPAGEPPGRAARIGARLEELEWALWDRIRSLPRLWYHWLQPTHLAREEAWIDRRSRSPVAH